MTLVRTNESINKAEDARAAHGHKSGPPMRCSWHFRRRWPGLSHVSWLGSPGGQQEPANIVGAGQIASQSRARSVPERLLQHAALMISPSTATAGPQHPLCVATAPFTPPNLLGSRPSPSLSLAFHPLSDRHGYIPSVDSGVSPLSSLHLIKREHVKPWCVNKALL